MAARRQMSEELEESVLDCMTCPSCHEFIQPPSHCCENGHFVCSGCKEEVCPVCRTLCHPNTNNAVFDRILREVLYPCAYQELGCEAFFKRDAIKDHQEGCLFRLVPCAFSPAGCPVLVPHRDLPLHEESCDYGTSCRVCLHVRGHLVVTCDWRGFNHELSAHVYETHPRWWLFHRIPSNTPTPWLLPLWKNVTRVELIQLEDLDEMFYKFTNVIAGSAQHITVQYIGHPKDAGQFYYRIVFRHRSKRISFENDVVSPSVKPENITKSTNGFTFSFDFLKNNFLGEERIIDYDFMISRREAPVIDLRRSITYSVA